MSGSMFAGAFVGDIPGVSANTSATVNLEEIKKGGRIAGPVSALRGAVISLPDGIVSSKRNASEPPPVGGARPTPNAAAGLGQGGAGVGRREPKARRRNRGGSWRPRFRPSRIHLSLSAAAPAERVVKQPRKRGYDHVANQLRSRRAPVAPCGGPRGRSG